MRNTPLPCLFVVLVAACADQPTARAHAAPGPGPARMLLRTENGFEAVPPVDAGDRKHLIAPRYSRVEGIPCALVERGHVEFAIFAGPEDVVPRPSFELIEHGMGERVVATRDGLQVIGEPTLPADVEGADLAILARQDGNTLTGACLLVCPEGQGELVLIGGLRSAEVVIDGATHIVPAGPHGALVLSRPGERVEIDARGELDQAYFAHARPLVERHPVDQVQVEWDSGGSLEDLTSSSRLEPLHAGRWAVLPVPLTREQQASTWTLVLSATLPAVHHPPVAREASSPKPPLVDVTREAGISFVHFEGPDEQLDIRPTMGPGVAWGDVDGDGLPDLYLVQGGGREGSRPDSDRLYRNLGDGTFEDVTERSGLAHEEGAGMGALLADLDGDGALDLYLANYGRDRIYRNAGDGSFVDVTDASGLPDLSLWSAGVCAADIEGDGDLDLYVTGYLDYDLAKLPDAAELGSYRREDPLEMLPFAFPGERNRLLLNDGNMRFRDVTEDRGLLDVAGRGMQPVFWDFDRDGDPDLYVANDVSFNVLFRNEGDGTFTDISFATGLDDPRGGMGLALADVDRDGDEDLFLTNWQLEANALYESLLYTRSTSLRRRSSFHDATVRSGLGPAGMGATSWGAVFFDLERDGDLDLFVANGYTSPDYKGVGTCVGQPNHLFIATRDARFEQRKGIPALELELASRAAAGCDYDRDGDVDLIVTANNGRTQLLRNDAKPGGQWLGVRLRGRGGNTAAIGAEVTVHLRDGIVRQTVRAGSSYLACEPAELVFGLGEDQHPQHLEVRWPWGPTTRYDVGPEGWEPDCWLSLEQPE